jgi:hypothetical protein
MGGRRHSGNVADQAVKLIRDFGEVLVSAAAEFHGVAEHLGVFAEHNGLTPFHLRHHHHGVLKIFDGLLVIHDNGVPLTILFSHGSPAIECPSEFIRVNSRPIRSWQPVKPGASQTLLKSCRTQEST